MISQSVTEELFLDYKQAATKKGSGKLDPSDRKNLAKAISGFGNSEGGIIVWGVDCRTTPQGDVPSDSPVDDPVAFKSLLDGAVGGVTVPAHGGVENVALELTRGTSGYVVTHVPQGMNVPYRTIIKNENDQYYVRAGSSFLPTPHAVLAGLFGRAPHSQLEIDLRFGSHNPHSTGPVSLTLRFSLSLRNKGRGFAKSIFVSIDTERPSKCHPRYDIDASRWNFWTAADGHHHRFTAVAKESFAAIPPGSEVACFDLKLEFHRTSAFGDVILNIVSGSETGPGSALTVLFPKEDLELIIANLTHDFPDEASRGAARERAREQIEACLTQHHTAE